MKNYFEKNTLLKGKFTFLFTLFFIKSTTFFAQDYELLYQKLEGDLLKHNSDIVIKSVDSLRVDKLISEKLLLDFKALKMEAMVQKYPLSNALKISDEILATSGKYSERAEVRLRIQRALIFEYFEQEQATLKELNALEKIYLTRPKDRYYGQYLYRKSSYYRILKPVKKSDSLGLTLAERAAVFGDENSYFKVSGTANLLKSFFANPDSLNMQIKYLQKSLNDFKLLKNSRYTSMIYLNLAKKHAEKNDPITENQYLDSTVSIAKKKNDLYLKSSAFNQKSLFFEKINKIDSALYYQKEFYKYEMLLNKEEQNFKVAEINFNNELEQQNKAILFSKNELKNSQRYNLFLFLFLLIIALMLAIIFVLYRRLKFQNKKLIISVNEKELLLKELNHRVKNNLSLIISLIKFQSQEIKENFYKEKFKELENRINTIAIAHEQFIYSENELEGIFYNLEEYLQKITAPLVNLSNREISFKQTIKVHHTNIDTALPIGMIMNELISNSIEHAIAKDVLKIRTCIEAEHNKIKINYFDSGSVFKNKENSDSLGLFIIDSMVKQLNGKISRKDSTFKIVIEYKN